MARIVFAAGSSPSLTAMATTLRRGMAAVLLLIGLPSGVMAQVAGQTSRPTTASLPAELAQLPAAQEVAQHLASGRTQEAAYVAVGIEDDRQRDQLLTYIATQRSAAGESGAQGGATEADFEELIELMKSTIDPTSWDDAGGVGAAQGFPGGVYVDSQGVLKRITRRRPQSTSAGTKADGRGAGDIKSEAAVDRGNRDVQSAAKLRKVSLTRLERQLQLQRALGQPVDDSMRYLAGLHRVQYVLVYPESGDLVIAGPAGPWQHDGEGRPINVTTGEPVLQLDDFVVMLRNAYETGGRFSCSITPSQENLRRTQAFLATSRAKPLRAGTRPQWLAQLRDHMGRQTIEVQGIDGRTRAAQVLVEADYRMKLVGMGLEPGVPGVPSYLELVELDANGQLPALEVLRWWFTLDEAAVTTNGDRDVFELAANGVVVLSENELLTRLGQRVHTGQAEAWNRQFADSFTRHFAELAAQYPIYADLRNVLHLSLVAGLIRHEDLAGQMDWHMTYFGDHRTGRGLKHAVAGTFVPREVETVINHREINARQFVAGVSGGVKVDASQFTRSDAIQTAAGHQLGDRRQSASPSDIPAAQWWWD